MALRGRHPEPAGAAHLHETIDDLVASANRADQRFQRLERRTERAVTALRRALGRRGGNAAAGVLGEAAELRFELSRVKDAAVEAQRSLADRERRSDRRAGAQLERATADEAETVRVGSLAER